MVGLTSRWLSHREVHAELRPCVASLVRNAPHRRFHKRAETECLCLGSIVLHTIVTVLLWKVTRAFPRNHRPTREGRLVNPATLRGGTMQNNNNTNNNN